MSSTIPPTTPAAGPSQRTDAAVVAPAILKGPLSKAENKVLPVYLTALGFGVGIYVVIGRGQASMVPLLVALGVGAAGWMTWFVWNNRTKQGLFTKAISRSLSL